MYIKLGGYNETKLKRKNAANRSELIYFKVNKGSEDHLFIFFIYSFDWLVEFIGYQSWLFIYCRITFACIYNLYVNSL